MKQPEIEHVGGLYKLSWPAEHIIIEVQRVVEHSDETKCQLTAYHSGLVIAQFNYNLNSLVARDKAAKHLHDKAQADWGMALEMASWHINKDLREGEPRIDLSMNADVNPIRWLLKPLIPMNMPTTIFADGGSGKSYLALIIAMISGFPWIDNPLGWETLSRPIVTLYLDWETERDIATYRLNRLCNGMGQPRPPIEYRRCGKPLALDLAAIQRHIMESKAELVIIDSVGLACGGDLKEQVSATNFFQSLRELRVTCLCLTHMSKSELTERKTAFGSVYFTNHSRCVWELSKSQNAGENVLTLALFQRKQNEMALHHPLVLQLEFNNTLGTTVFRPASIDDAPDLRERQSLRDQLKHALRFGPLSLTDLGTELGKPTESLRVTLYKYKNDFVNLGNEWALKATQP